MVCEHFGPRNPIVFNVFVKPCWFKFTCPEPFNLANSAAGTSFIGIAAGKSPIPFFAKTGRTRCSTISICCCKRTTEGTQNGHKHRPSGRCRSDGFTNLPHDEQYSILCPAHIGCPQTSTRYRPNISAPHITHFISQNFQLTPSTHINRKCQYTTAASTSPLKYKDNVFLKQSREFVKKS